MANNQDYKELYLLLRNRVNELEEQKDKLISIMTDTKFTLDYPGNCQFSMWKEYVTFMRERFDPNWRK